MRIRREVTPPPALLGDNVACALQALALVDALPDAALVQVTLPQITLAGRLQRRRLGKGECVLDVAHNPAGVACLVRRLADAPARGCTRILFGAMRDKDAGAMLATLAPLADAWVFPALSEPRALTAAEVLAALGAAQRSRPVECVPGIAHALVRAERTMVPGDRLVVCGSFHLVGPALEWLDAHA